MSNHHPPLSSSKDLFTPPPLFAQPYDPLAPNPIILLNELEDVEHFILMSRGTVEEMRLLGCQIIQSGVKFLKMSQASLYTAHILFNQFYARESFLDFPLIDVAMASVFVAGKVEECIRRARDIVNVFHHLYCLIRNLPAHPIDYVGDTYYIWRDRLCTMESLLLRELGFHVQPSSPVSLLLSYMKILEITDHLEVAQVALNYLNDSLKTSVHVLFQPHVIAVSSISLALDKLSLVDQLIPPARDLTAPWFTLFDVNETELIECKKIIMTIYNRELDVLLPLTKEELVIFSSSIKDLDHESNNDQHEKINKHDHNDSKQSDHLRNRNESPIDDSSFNSRNHSATSSRSRSRENGSRHYNTDHRPRYRR